jgi:hypothetical protein
MSTLTADEDTVVLARCTTCRAALDEARQACEDCRQTAERHLMQLSGPDGLYAALSDALAPSGGAGGPRVSGSRERALGARGDVLDLMSPSTGVPGILRAWAQHWHSVMGKPCPRPVGVTAAAHVDSWTATLRFNLDWAARSLPEWAEFADEMHRLVRACRAAGDRHTPRRPAVGRCEVELDDGAPCGGTLRYDPRSNVTRCDTCHGSAAPDWRAIRKAVDRLAPAAEGAVA